VLTASIMMISINVDQITWCNIPEDNHLHICCYENLKSHKPLVIHQMQHHLVTFTKLTSCNRIHKVEGWSYFLHILSDWNCWQHGTGIKKVFWNRMVENLSSCRYSSVVSLLYKFITKQIKIKCSFLF
jgi:hypothetical protein